MSEKQKSPIELAVMEVYFWQFSNTGSFTNMLLDLFRKADRENNVKLTVAYPELSHALALWDAAGDAGNDLFREYGLIK